jgi:uncharacterized protein (DUF58 family)
MMKREKLYIIPTQYGFMYAGGIFSCLIGGAVYNNNLAFVLCFFLVALFLIGMVQSHNNLKKIKIEKVSLFLSPSEGVGHGMIWLKSQNSDGHLQLRVQCQDNDDVIDFSIQNIYKQSLHSQYFDFKTNSWGKKQVTKFKISTRFPFGFFYVWRYFKCPTEYYIFPKPIGEENLPDSINKGENEGHSRQKLGDDFSEHRKFTFGDSMKHIDWKAYARGRSLLTKKFEEGQKNVYEIDFDLAKGNREKRFHQLSQWVHQCEKQQLSYSLKIGPIKIPTSYGERHKSNCLKMLATQKGLN